MSESLRSSASAAFQAIGRRLRSRVSPQEDGNDVVEINGKNFQLTAGTEGDTTFLNGLRIQLHGSVDVGEGTDHETAEIHMTNIQD